MREVPLDGVQYRWSDEAPFEPQPQEYECSVCGSVELRGLTIEQVSRLRTLRQPPVVR